jgi:hypothetical protein
MHTATASRGVVKVLLVRSAAHTVPERAMTDATERSIPPLAITKVEPRARRPITPDAESIFCAFDHERKWGDNAVKTATRMHRNARQRATLIRRLEPR